MVGYTGTMVMVVAMEMRWEMMAIRVHEWLLVWRQKFCDLTFVIMVQGDGAMHRGWLLHMKLNNCPSKRPRRPTKEAKP